MRVPVERLVDVLRAPPVLRADDFFAVDFRAGERLAVDFFAVDLLAVDFFAVDLRAVERFAVDFFAAERFAVDFFAAERFALDFFADDLRVDVVRFAAPVLLAVVLRADVVLRAVVFFFAVDFLAPPDFFFAVDFFADDFRPLELRVDPERELLPEERDDERVVAGTAMARSTSAPSLASPIAVVPHASSASAVGSLHEPALDVSDVSPVPLQSSSVIETSWSDCACTIPYHVAL